MFPLVVPHSSLTMWLLCLLLILDDGEASCHQDESSFHGLVEAAWTEGQIWKEGMAWKEGHDLRAAGKLWMESQTRRDGQGDLELPKERLGSLRNYCNCKGEEEPTDFCRSVFVSYHSAQRDIKLGKYAHLDIKPRGKKYLKEMIPAKDLLKSGTAKPFSFLSDITKQLQVRYVVAIVDAGDWSGPPFLSGLARESLSSQVFLTVLQADAGRNLSLALLQPGNLLAPTAVFLLGRHTSTTLFQVRRHKDS